MSAWSDRHPIRGHQCSLEASPLTPFGTSSRTCAKREIGIERSVLAGGEHRPDLSGRCRVRRRAPRSYANVFHRRGRLCGVDTDVRQRTAVPWRRRVLGTRNRGGPELVPRLSGGHIHQRVEDVLWMSRDRDLSPSGKDVYVAFNVKLASYVAVSHDAGRTFSQVKTSNESLWWYSYGGTYAPDGGVYFAQAGEAGAKTNGKRTNQGHTDGVQKIFVLKMNHEGTAWENVYLDTSMVAAPCGVAGCYGDYFAG